MAADPLKASSPSRLHTGDQIGPYVIVDTLGTGGMGEVYRARDARLERDVAIKRLSSSAIGGDEARARVLREARAAAALTHPNIAAVYDVLETRDGLVIVMEYVPGESVAARLARGPMPVEEAVRVGLQIADATTCAGELRTSAQELQAIQMKRRSTLSSEPPMIFQKIASTTSTFAWVVKRPIRA